MAGKGDKKRGRLPDSRIIFHIVSGAALLISLLFSVFYFRPVFFRTVQAFKDFGLSVAYYFTELLGFEGTITPTVGEIPDNAVEVLPFDPEEFRAGLQAYGKALISEENAAAFFAGLARALSRGAKILLLLLPAVLLVYLLIRNAYQTPNNDYAADTKPLQLYKKIEAATWGRCKAFCKSYAAFLGARRGYLWAAALIWAYNLNAVTIFVEFLAWVFYFAISLDVLHIYTQIAKLAMDLTVAVGFLPWWAWALIGLAIFDGIRKGIGTRRLRGYEARDRAFLDEHPGALFIVGKQRAKKTTMITDMALSQEAIFREAAKEKLKARDMQFPLFPWILLEKFVESGTAAGQFPTLAKVRKFFGILRRCHYELHGGRERKRARKMLREKYGYPYSDFLFGYDPQNGMTYKAALGEVDLFDALEAYAQLYWIYSAPTPLLIGNYAIRTDAGRIDYGNFPIYTDDFFSKEAQPSAYSHILDEDGMRLGKVFDEKGRYKDGLEIGIVNIMEVAKDRGNQHTRAGGKNAEECNQNNDLFELDVKMRGHAATVDNYTFFRMFMDDQRPDSLGADNKQLCDTVMIKKMSPAKIVMPGFAFEEAAYLLATGVFDKIYYKQRALRGDNTLFLYLAKKLYGVLFRHFERVFNRFSVYVGTVRVTNEMAEERITDKGKYYICTYKVYNNRFATDGIREFYTQKALRSKTGLNDFPQYKGLYPSCEEMQSVHSFFYKDVFKAFGIENAVGEQKAEAGVKYVWQSSRAEKYRSKAKKPGAGVGPAGPEEKRPGAGRGNLTYPAAPEAQRRREPAEPGDTDRERSVDREKAGDGQADGNADV